jgi:hypothetical protein
MGKGKEFRQSILIGKIEGLPDARCLPDSQTEDGRLHGRWDELLGNY